MSTARRKKNRGWKIVGTILAVLVILVSSALGYVTCFLPAVGNPPAIKVVSTPQLVARGEYLANHVMACMDCHSARVKTEFAGPIEAGTLGKGGEAFTKEMGFPGTFYASNITPAGIGTWTDGEIFKTITTGVTKDGRAIFPVMPYLHYGTADSLDVIAVIAYLRSLPPITNAVADSKADFPMNIILHTIPKMPHFTKRPDTSQTLQYGAYLVNAAACVDCHTKMEKGKLVESMMFAGGRTFEFPGGTVSSSNLTPDKETGLGAMNEKEFIARFSKFRDTTIHRPVTETDFNSPMPWLMYAGMKNADLVAIYKYLQSLKPIKNAVIKFTPKA